jgi:alkanesulfonate monooxygenase SsuD/methylene tetrahydromethanopterin reductase-like flavin-dependent oxidoreductase (luciferase family)
VTGPDPFRLGLGLGAASGDYELFRRCAAAAERGGFSFVSVGDNPGALKETYVSLSVLAMSTETCRIGTAVTNPVHRDPLVVASAFSSVESLAPGRVFCGIGTGRARRPASLDTLRQHVAILRDLWAKEEADYRGETLRLGWDARPVPIFVCVSGPRGLRLAGEIADGVIVESGVNSESVAQAEQWIREGAGAAGRDADAIERWWYLKTAVAETDEEALSQALAPVAASGGFVLGRDPGVHGVPNRFHDDCRRLRAGYDKSAHISTGPDDPNRRLLEPGPFRDYLFDRFALAGSPAAWGERIAELRTRGVQNVFCAAVVPDIEYFVQTVSESVLAGSGSRA